MEPQKAGKKTLDKTAAERTCGSVWTPLSFFFGVRFVFFFTWGLFYFWVDVASLFETKLKIGIF